jgi:hypothetical protein
LQSNLTDPNHPPQPYHQLPSSSLSPLPHGHHSQPIHTHQRGSGLHGKNSVNSMSSDGNDNRFLKILYTSVHTYIHTYIHTIIHTYITFISTESVENTLFSSLVMRQSMSIDHSYDIIRVGILKKQVAYIHTYIHYILTFIPTYISNRVEVVAHFRISAPVQRLLIGKCVT